MEKKQKLLEKLIDLKVMAVNALEGDEALFSVDTNEMLDLIELAFQIYDAERKPGFTLRRADGTSVTVETECVSIQCTVPIEGGYEGSMYNSIRANNNEMLALSEMQGKAQESLLKSIKKSLLAELDELLGGGDDEKK